MTIDPRKTARELERKRIAAERAEKIRLGLQSTAVLYARAVTEDDWRVLGYASIEAWREAEFGPVRFKTDYRKEISALLTAKGWTAREIAAATGAALGTVSADQQEAAGVQNRTPASEPQNQTPRQQAARQREKTRKERGATVRQQAGATEEQITACVKMIRRGLSQTDAGKRLGLKDNSMILAAAYAAARERIGQPSKRGRATNLNGKTNPQRERELAEARRAGAHLELIEFQTRIAQMCSRLEAFNVKDYGTEDVDVWLMADLLDDLISLGEWHSRQISAVIGYLNEADVRSRIAKLRDVTGRTPEEAAKYIAKADELERKLGARLT